MSLHTPSPSPHPDSIPRTPKSPFSAAARMMTPLASPMKKAIASMQTYLEEVGHLTKLDPQDSWLPITESRNGNAYYAAFHTLSSGIGFQALLLPLAFTTLGWYVFLHASNYQIYVYKNIFFIVSGSNYGYFFKGLGNYKPVFGFYLAIIHLMATDTTP